MMSTIMDESPYLTVQELNQIPVIPILISHEQSH